MKPLASFPEVDGKVCEIVAAPGGFYLRLPGPVVSTVVRHDADARWLNDSALLTSNAKEVRWSGEAWAAWEAR